MKLIIIQHRDYEDKDTQKSIIDLDAFHTFNIGSDFIAFGDGSSFTECYLCYDKDNPGLKPWLEKQIEMDFTKKSKEQKAKHKED